MYDCLIIGAGHNGLVCGAYLAAAGRKVLLLERHHTAGGAAITEEIAPGYRASTASYLVSLLLPEVERDLDLRQHGYKPLPRNPSSFTPCEDGRSLLMGPDGEFNRREIAKFSARDAEAYPRYEALLTRIAECLEPTMMQPAADLLPLPRKQGALGLLRQGRRGLSLYRAFQKLGADMPEALELLTGPATPILDRWFESDVLKGTLATDAIIGAMTAPSMPGSGYVLLHHVMGVAGGARGCWAYVEGGMGALSQAMQRAAEARGAQIRCNAEVAEILIEGGRACGVRLKDGEVIRARQVISNATADVTFNRLIPAEDALPADFRAGVRRIDYSSASMKINLALSELPDFLCLPGRESGPQHRGTIHIGSTLEHIERAYDDAKWGRPSERPVIEMTLPSVLDHTLAPPGQHIAQLFVQYAPYKLAAGLHWDAIKNDYADRVIAQINELAPNFARSVLHRQVLSPLDLERRFALTGGNIFQGAMPLHQLFMLRPVPGWSDYRTPLPGLFLCGAATHPGGGVMGACGRNAAQEILRG